MSPLDPMTYESQRATRLPLPLPAKIVPDLEPSDHAWQQRSACAEPLLVEFALIRHSARVSNCLAVEIQTR